MVKNSVIGAVSTAIQDYVNNLPIGVPLAVTWLAQIAYAAHQSIINVTDIRVNGDSLYQPAYPVSGFAHCRPVMEAIVRAVP